MSKEEEETKIRFRVRTVTAFVCLDANDFPALIDDDFHSSAAAQRIAKASQLLQVVHAKLVASGYEVQTLRIATNPFGQYLVANNNDDDDASQNKNKKKELTQVDLQTAQVRLDMLSTLLQQHNITFCALGPAQSLSEIQQLCTNIVACSPSFSCSADIPANDVLAAQAAAKVIHDIARLEHIDSGLGNFRFCATAACCKSYIPFFPAAKAATDVAAYKNNGVAFALGLENGHLIQQLLQVTKSIAHIPTIFAQGMTNALKPLQEMCQQLAAQHQEDGYHYLGLDSSLNPSLEEGGSIAAAMEQLEEIETFGGPGTVAAAAAITTAIQSLPDIRLTGYCGLMLPVCEDQRLADLATTTTSTNSTSSDSSSNPQQLRISDLLSVSSVCGVGIDTVPLSGDVSASKVTALLLDMAGLAARWNKSLSCRVLPFPGKAVGDITDFDSPYMVNTQVFQL